MPQNTITLPPIVITPDPPITAPSPSVTFPGVILARPLPWDGKLPSNSELDSFFSQKGIKTERFTMAVVMTVAVAQRNIEQSYTAYLPQLPGDINSEIGAALGSDFISTLDRARAEKAIVDSLTTQSTEELHRSNQAAHAFFGRNVLAREIKKSAVDFVNIFQTRSGRRPPLEVYKSWEASATAAYRAKILEEKIGILTQKSAALVQTIAAAQAEEDARIAIEAEARRVAAEAAENALLVKKEDAQRVAQQQAARQAIFTSAGTIAMPAGANVITIAGQGLVLAGEGAASLAQAIAEGVAALGRIAVAGPGAYIATFLSLALYSSSTADESQDQTPDHIRYGFGTDADQLGLPPDTDLQSIALAQGTVEMPMRLTSEARGNRSFISVVTADGTNIPKAVPVRVATLNPTTGLYESVILSTIPDQQPITLTWTPADPPLSENPSSTTPAISQEIPLYTGVTLQPIVIEAEPYPALLPTLNDFIIWFPAASGIKPVYVMLNSPYDGATTKGKYSGRMYNPDKAGGPIQKLDWTTASVTQEGIELVKLHTGRFDPSDGNNIMIDRLEKILRGEISISDIDKRFYTHEIRELERYRALGLRDSEEGSVWNDTHTATLEDYGIDEMLTPLYTEDAISADEKQDYARALKEK
ncbi:S-type pyocin domain-containing protein [Pseudomonas folii]|uniref:S-type pyocin domain-containing protein n=1 Tax=Pseudomonas folii TaxID=2762593 RepID=A0ABR7B2D5_9PSED|nr:S-type pyocin domain-containing protein [Pseudomonas folii]MBC3951332.1 S-type pyocin domain-containing protein [Pseudomonas folii]